jgi:nitrite reductase (cytochrome c-552)
MSTPSTGFGARDIVRYGLAALLVAAATVGVILLLENIEARKTEAREHVFRVAEITEETIDPAIWGRNYPRQYDGYLRTVDVERTRHGGSEAFQHLEEDPVWRDLFRGYAFGIDYREERGHAYMLSDQEQTERVTKFKQPGACLHCHTAVIPTYLEAARRFDTASASLPREEQIMRGFAIASGMPYTEAHALVDQHPVSCGDCHDPASMQLRVTRPGFINGIRALAASSEPVPHLPSIERWRSGNRARPYDANRDASRQEMRSFACGQCHVEYYFKGDSKVVTYPWHNGLRVEQIEAYYDSVAHKDWVHTLDSAPVLKAQHPEFELWSQGIHARSGVACADCHMPYKREGAIKVSDHHIRSPLLNVARACQTCHRFPEGEMQARAERIQDRNQALMDRAEAATIALIRSVAAAKEAGATDEMLKSPRALHRKAQWRLDFVAAENSMGFHAPQEAARILAEAIDYARQGEVEAERVRARVGMR